jgi:hypothetical protein
MQMTIATLEDRPIRHEVWVFSEQVVVEGSVQTQGKEIAQKIAVNSTSDQDISSAIDINLYRTGKAVVVGLRDFQAGDIEELVSMQIDPEDPQSGEKLMKSGHINIHLESGAYVAFSPEEWSGVAPNITVSQEVIDALDQTSATSKVQSIVNGVLTLWQ